MREEKRYQATPEQYQKLLDLADKECLGEGVKSVMLHIASYDGESAERYINFCVEQRKEDIAFNELALMEDITIRRTGIGKRRARIRDYVF